jgi:L-histidine Nalpha-methyltransferase
MGQAYATKHGAVRAVDGDRLRIEVYREPWLDGDLATDVRRGLLAARKTLPPKYFYDEHGARLFDRICELPEYYLTRTEQALLLRFADDIVARTRPSAVVELGSGAARKTRTLLDAVHRSGCEMHYVPVDVSDGMLHRSALTLLRDYSRLRIHGVVGDYERDLEHLPDGRQRLIVFLGSTIGNFTPAATQDFLRALRRQLTTSDHLLLGVDLVKSVDVLEAAYNDSAGITAEFNRNVLRVINRHLDATFDPNRFEHVAFFNRERSQIEMHLRTPVVQQVRIRQLGLTVSFFAGETIHTEISRKFARPDVELMLSAAGFALLEWYTPPDRSFGLVLASAI